ncbi:MAG: DnaJ domain-containing protein, partial [Sphingomicrobium sp.]
EAARRAADEARDSKGFNHAQHWGWGGPGDGSRSREEMRALSILEIDSDAEYPAIKAAYRRLAKDNHPDLKPGDADAATRFTQVKAAYDVLSKAEERRLALGDAAGADAG